MPEGTKDKNIKARETAKPYPIKGRKPNGDSQEESLFYDRCTSVVNHYPVQKNARCIFVRPMTDNSG